jgi:hypothetical protein
MLLTAHSSIKGNDATLLFNSFVCSFSHFTFMRFLPTSVVRGIQLDLHGTPYHSIDYLKTYVRLARFYKLNIVTFNIGPSIWLSPIMNSTGSMNTSWLEGKNSGLGCYNGACVFYTHDQISDLVQYGAARGVRFVPCISLMPGKSEIVRVLSTRMLPPGVEYPFHDWMDEVDGKGPSTCVEPLKPLCLSLLNPRLLMNCYCVLFLSLSVVQQLVYGYVLTTHAIMAFTLPFTSTSLRSLRRLALIVHVSLSHSLTLSQILAVHSDSFSSLVRFSE